MLMYDGLSSTQMYAYIKVAGAVVERADASADGTKELKLIVTGADGNASGKQYSQTEFYRKFTHATEPVLTVGDRRGAAAASLRSGRGSAVTLTPATGVAALTLQVAVGSAPASVQSPTEAARTLSIEFKPVVDTRPTPSAMPRPGTDGVAFTELQKTTTMRKVLTMLGPLRAAARVALMRGAGMDLDTDIPFTRVGNFLASVPPDRAGLFSKYSFQKVAYALACAVYDFSAERASSRSIHAATRTQVPPLFTTTLPPPSTTHASSSSPRAS